MLDPAVRTQPLSPDFPSLWDRWAKPILIIWRVAFGFTLDAWQQELLRAVLEVYPQGHPRAGELRYRQVLISMGRQNGKTEILSVLGIIGLLRRDNSLVIGIASSADQATIVYKRALHAVLATTLRKRFARLTGTRGIETKSGSVYTMKAAKDAALQGLALDLGMVDEVHLLKAELWTALVNGLGGRPNGQVIGITTAGDDQSELLKQLYVTGQRAAEGDPDLERFGCFIFEAPESRVPDNDDELLAYLRAANPALEEGRLDPELVLADVRAMPEADIIRYRLNRFTESTSSFIPLSLWAGCRSTADWPTDVRPIFALDVTPSSEFATISVAAKDASGVIHTQVVASFVRPSIAQLISVCQKLQTRHAPHFFAVSTYFSKEFSEALIGRGMKVRKFSLSDHINGAGRFYSLIAQKKVAHPGDLLLTVQLPGAIRKNKESGFRINPKDASVQVDAVISTMTSVYLADVQQESPGLQLW